MRRVSEMPVVVIALIFVLFNLCSCAQKAPANVVSGEISFPGISVVDYGAKPAKDWPQAIDNSAAFQKAIDENPGRMIFVPAGIYLLSKSLIISHGVSIVGENKHGTILQPIDCDGIVIKTGGVSIKDLFLYGRGHTGIYVSGRNNTLSDIMLQNVKIGISLEDAWNTKMHNVDIAINPNQNPKVEKGIVFSGQCVNNHLTNSQLTATDIGIEILKKGAQSEGLMINNVVISSAKTGLKSEGILSLHLSNSIIDLCTSFGLDIKGTGGLLVSNCWIASKGSNKAQAVKLSACWDSHLTSNNIKCELGENVLLLDKESNNNIISNNTLELVTGSSDIIHLERTTSMNIIKDNSFKMPRDKPVLLKNAGIKNQVAGNLNLDI